MLVLWLVLFAIIRETENRSLLRLSTNQYKKLTINDTLYSTLGFFRVQIEPESCSLRVQEFTGSSYFYKGMFSHPFNNMPCDYVIVGQGVLQTPQGINLMKIDKSDLLFNFTTLTIDDIGIIRLIGIFERYKNTNGEEARITEFREPKNLIYATSDISVSNLDTLSFRRNKRGWGFSAYKGEIRIFMLENSSRIISYKYDSFKINPDKICDSRDIEPPYSNIKGFKYPPRCGRIQSLNFKAPFVFQVDDYWPQLRMLDQGGYELMSIRYPNYQCIKEMRQLQLIDQQECISWFCPPQTFQHQGQCITKCPDNYFHSIKQNKKNRCVLQCQQGSIQSGSEFGIKVCTCGNQWMKPKCPANTNFYGLGCTCKNQTFYLEHLECLKACPETYYAHFSGVCIQCPYNCKTCKQASEESALISYLECGICNQGYVLIEGGCRKNCIYTNTAAVPVTNTCPVCEDKNCLQCSHNSGSVCDFCMKPFILLNGTCLSECPVGYIFQMKKFSKNSFFVCKPPKNCSQIATGQVLGCRDCNDIENFCFKRCEIKQIYNNQSRCFCRKSQTAISQISEDATNYGFIEQCLPQDEKQTICPYKNYLYSNTNECLPCPFGCLSCQQDEDGMFQCTSCAPSYFLVISIAWGYCCQRDTSITTCQEGNVPKFYDSVNKICEYQNKTIYSTLNIRTLCLDKQPQCLSCLFKSSSICTFCKQGYFLFKGGCHKVCPKNTIPYHRVCLIYKTNKVSYLDNCEIPEVVSYNHLINVNQKSQKNEGYSYLLAKSLMFGYPSQRNDPIIQLYIFIANTIMLGMQKVEDSREGLYDEGLIICRKCLPHFGLEIQTGQCLKCQQFQACQRCLHSNLSLCVICHKDYYLDRSSGVCIEKTDLDKECREGEYRLQNGTCSKVCLGFFLLNQTSSTNCTASCPYTISSFDGQLACSKNVLGSQLSEQNQRNNSMFIAASHFSSQIFVLIPLQKPFSVNNSITSCQYKTTNNGNFETCLLDSRRRLLQSKDNIIAQQSKIIVRFHQKDLPSLIKITLNPNLLTPDPPYLTNSIYYFTPESPSYHDLINTGLASYGNIYVFILFVMAILFLSDDLTYKTDNLFIMFQVLPLFLYSLNLKQIFSKDIYSFYYGFKWTVGHLFGAPHGVSLMNENELPFIENTPNNAHQLINIDNNVLRNTYVLLIILAVTGTLCFLIFLFMKFMAQSESESHRKKYLKIDLDHRTKLINFFIFLLQLASLPILYFALSNIMNSRWQASSGPVYIGSFALSVIAIILISIYSLFRFFFHKIGGIYMFKRVYLAIVLAMIKGNSLIFLYAIIGQVVFTLGRLYFEILVFQSSIRDYKNKLIILLVEQGLILLGIILMGLIDSNNSTFHLFTVAYIWVAINLIIAALLLELFEYFMRVMDKQEQLERIQKQKKIYIQRIRKSWDYQKIDLTDSSIN